MLPNGSASHNSYNDEEILLKSHFTVFSLWFPKVARDL